MPNLIFWMILVKRTKLIVSFSRQRQTKSYSWVFLYSLGWMYSPRLSSLTKIEAARIVTELTRSLSLENLYRECGWRPLSERRMKNKLVFMYNAVNERVPSYISDLISPLVKETIQYPLRNNNNIILPFARTEISRRYCIPSSISLWNSFEHDFREAHNVNAFKYRLKKHKFSTLQVPLYYFDGERYVSVMHARMRNKCSNLKHDLYSNHLVQSPFCNCADVSEDAEYFFF